MGKAHIGVLLILLAVLLHYLHSLRPLCVPSFVIVIHSKRNELLVVGLQCFSFVHILEATSCLLLFFSLCVGQKRFMRH